MSYEGEKVRLKNIGMLLVLTAMSCQVAMAISIHPTYQIFDLKPGKKAKGTAQVTNNSEAPIYIIPGTKDWFVLPENKEFETKDWLTVNTTDFILNPGDSKMVEFSLKAPRKAVGELVSMLSFVYRSENSSINQRFSVAIYLNVKGTEEIKSKLEGIAVDVSSRSVRAGVIVSNKGNVHVRPRGLFQIRDNEDKSIANVFLKKGRPTYPGQSRSYFGEVHDLKLTPGKYVAVLKLEDADRDVPLLSSRKKFVITKDMRVKVK